MNWETISTYFHETSALEWQPIPRLAVIGLTLVIAYITWQHYLTTDQWVMVLDHANLAIHEAGHPIVGLFSSRLAVYGEPFFSFCSPYFSHSISGDNVTV